MATLGEVVFAIAFGKADTKNLDDAERKGLASAKKVEGGWSNAAKNIGKSFAIIGAAAGGAAIGIFKLVESTATAGDEIAKTSKGLGIAANELQRLRFAAERSGGTAQGMTRALRTFTVGLQDAATKGTGPVAEGLDAIGLSFADLQGRGVEQQFGIIAEALKGVEDATERSAISMKLFGSRGGAALAPLLNEGRAGIKALGDEAERLGIVMGEDALRASEKFADDMLDLKGVILGLTRDVAGGLIPEFSAGIAKVREWIVVNREFIAGKVREYLDRILEVLTDLLPLFKASGQVTITLAEAASKLAEAVGPTGLVAAFIALRLAMTGLPGLIAGVSVAVGIALGGLISDLSGTNDEIRRLRAETDQLRGRSERDRKATAAIEALTPGSERNLIDPDVTSDAELEGIVSDFRAGAGGADREGVRALEGRIARIRQTRAAIKQARAKAGFRTSREKAQERQMAIAKGRRKPGGGRGDEIVIEDLGPGEELVGDEVRRLAERFGAGDIAVQASIEAAQQSLAGGSTAAVARQAALGRLGGAVGRDLTTPTSDPLLSELLGEDVPDVELSAISRGAQPQVLISTINNTFTFDNDFQIDGTGDPSVVAQSVAGALRDAFEGALQKSTKTAKVNFAR